MAKGRMTYREADRLLRKTYSEIKPQHSERGHRFIEEHWTRYIGLLALMPPLSRQTRVLEIGASILSAHLFKTYQCPVTVVYHEIESEWKERFSLLGIPAYPVELMRDCLPVENDSYDLILFNEVMEHFPLHPGFFMRQLIQKLSAHGELLFTVPNFATSEKRLQLFLGKNPQDSMDEQFVYYAHHREPVMAECVELVEECGGTVVYHHWCDFDGDPALIPLVKRHLFHFYRHRLHPFLHLVFPSLRKYLVVKAAKKAGFDFARSTLVPPLSASMEFSRKR